MTVNKMTLDGRTALVTGAAGGIGGAICRHLRIAGARVALCDLDGEAARRQARNRESDDRHRSGDAPLRCRGERHLPAGRDADERRVLRRPARRSNFGPGAQLNGGCLAAIGRLGVADRIRFFGSTVTSSAVSRRSPKPRTDTTSEAVQIFSFPRSGRPLHGCETLCRAVPAGHCPRNDRHMSYGVSVRVSTVFCLIV